MAASGSATPPQRQPPLTVVTGNSPLAKRATPITRGVGAVGPRMAEDEFHNFVYALRQKVDDMEGWAQTANEAITDHAERIDETKRSAHAAFKLVHERTEALTMQDNVNERDTREVMRLVEANDIALKASLAAMTAIIDSEVTKLSQTMDTRVRELQAATSAQAAGVQQMTASPSADTSALSAEVAALRALFVQHESIQAHLLDPSVLTARLSAIEQQLAQQSRGVAATAQPTGPGQQDAAGVGQDASFIDRLTQAATGGQQQQQQQRQPPLDPWAEGRARQQQQQQQQVPLWQQQQQQQPQQYNIGFGSSSGFGQSNPGDRLKLDLKLAQIDKHIYSDAAPETWHKEVRTYLIGAHVDVSPFLNWVEAQKNTVITEQMLHDIVPSGIVMMNLDPIQVSRELWSWINLCLTKSTSARQTFHNVQELNGAEVYRRLVTPLGLTQPSITRRGILRDKVQTPSRAKNMITIMDAVKDWETSKLAFHKAGGTQHSDEEERAQLYKILPTDISEDMLSHAHDKATSPLLIEWMRGKSEFLTEHGKRGRDGGIHVADEQHSFEPPPAPYKDENGHIISRYNDYDDYSYYYDDSVDVSTMNDAEALAFVRKGGKGKGKGKGKYGKGYGDRKGFGKGYGSGNAQQPPPKDLNDLKCPNCGGKHGGKPCHLPYKPMNERPCHKCGKPGHISRNCTGQALAIEGGDSAASNGATHFNLDGQAKVCAADSEPARTRGRPFNKTVDSEGFELVRGGYPMGDIPIKQPQISQKAAKCARKLRFSLHSAMLEESEREAHGAVSSLVIAAPAVSAGVIGGQVEPEVPIGLGCDHAAASADSSAPSSCIYTNAYVPTLHKPICAYSPTISTASTHSIAIARPSSKLPSIEFPEFGLGKNKDKGKRQIGQGSVGSGEVKRVVGKGSGSGSGTGVGVGVGVGVNGVGGQLCEKHVCDLNATTSIGIIDRHALQTSAQHNDTQRSTTNDNQPRPQRSPTPRPQRKRSPTTTTTYDHQRSPTTTNDHQRPPTTNDQRRQRPTTTTTTTTTTDSSSSYVENNSSGVVIVPTVISQCELTARIGGGSGPDNGARTAGHQSPAVRVACVHAKEVTLEATQTPPLSDFLDTCASQSVRGDGSANLCRQRPRSTQSLLSIAGSNHWPDASGLIFRSLVLISQLVPLQLSMVKTLIYKRQVSVRSLQLGLRRLRLQ